MQGDPGYFGPQSMMWKVNKEITVLFGGARALLMHAAHPLIAAGARQTSFYQRDPWKRLIRTLSLQNSVTFGTKSEADESAHRINKLHEVIKGEDSLGTWLVSNVMDERFPPQMIDAGDRSFEIALRFTRHYYPFEIELIDFKHEKYPGTEVPFNFSSEVKVTHQDSTKNQKALIYMNHPLRYEGLTFFQASFANQDKTSIFQVVRNPGWLLPYLSVLLMGLGMCTQFGMHFFKFLGKQRR